MKHFKSIGLVVLAALALTAIAGASLASASEPQAESTFPNKFTGHGGTGQLFVTPEPDLPIHCTGSTSKGEITSATTAANVQVTFSGCKGPLGVNCHSAGEGTGGITTNVLHGTIVYLETNSSRAGILLKPATEGGNFASFTCTSIFGNTNISVKGQVLAELTPVNTTTKEFVLHFSQASKGHPLPASYLAPAGCAHTSTTDALLTTSSGLFNFANKPSSLVGTHTITLEKDLKVNSTKCV
jgi:hypothetical protein